MTGSGQLQRQYRISLRGELSRRFEAEFEGMALESGDGKTLLRGAVDQSQLHGILERIHDFNLEIIEVEEIAENPERMPTKKNEEMNR